ncbi:uncharacterized protein DEA37_0006209 [Paragonimus westermani]|uniref:Uncharacterized protein n=1 Tax=Paragonimus westermani TaxID=34504 RepID=A0A5J4NVK6_9TREM|nr:uncharacterized protein DEA37_0006209 [Paragonimus westermani]
MHPLDCNVTVSYHMSSEPCRRSTGKTLLHRIFQCFSIQPEPSPSESENQGIVSPKTDCIETSCYTSSNETEQAASGRGDVLTNEVQATCGFIDISVGECARSPSVNKTARTNLPAVYNIQESQNNNIVINIRSLNRPPTILKHLLENEISLTGDDYVFSKGDIGTNVKISSGNSGEPASVLSKFPIRIDSIVYAANQVASVSQLLSNAITVLKQHACSEYMQSIKDKETVINASTNQSTTANGLNYAPVPLLEDYPAEILSDIPPLR